MDRVAAIERGPNLEVLPQVRSLALSLFVESLRTNSDWKSTLDALEKFISVARKADSPKDLVEASTSHALAYFHYLVSLPETSASVTSFSNLTAHWWGVFEDLRNIYLASRYFNSDPQSLVDVLDALAYIDELIWEKYSDSDEISKWRETRRSLRVEYPGLPDVGPR